MNNIINNNYYSHLLNGKVSRIGNSTHNKGKFDNTVCYGHVNGPRVAHILAFPLHWRMGSSRNKREIVSAVSSLILTVALKVMDD